jgi:hypothetical protein
LDGVAAPKNNHSASAPELFHQHAR